MVRLLILGLLSLRPMSGYQIQQYLQLSKVDQWSDILPGSIYHALKKLDSDGLITLQSTEQTGMRTKAIYAITEAGRQEYRRLLREAWRTPPRSLPSDFYLLLSFVDDLPRAEVIQSLQDSIAQLEEALANWQAGLAAKEAAMGFLPPIIKATFAHGETRMEADLRFLRYLVETLPQTLPINRDLPKMEEE